MKGFSVYDKRTKDYDCDREFVLNSRGELMELRPNHDGTWEYRFADTDRFVIEQLDKITEKQFIKLIEEMLFKNYQTTISIGDTKYFASVHRKHTDGADSYTVVANRKAIDELCGEEEE